VKCTEVDQSVGGQEKVTDKWSDSIKFAWRKEIKLLM
jgi:hypothetical protein